MNIIRNDSATEKKNFITINKAMVDFDRIPHDKLRIYFILITYISSFQWARFEVKIK